MSRKEILITLAIILLLAVFISPFASDFPDGLERVAEDKHFMEEAQDSPLPGNFADYTFPFIRSAAIQTAMAGLLGSAIVFLLAAGFGKLLRYFK